ncbi:MAG TPA: glutathione binding-like protein [Lysobacter sp.]|nr:glutathione binding-like protein [Lysobacter sp.]
MLALYYAPGACSVAAHVALEEAGAVFEPRALSYPRGDFRAPAYLALNADGQVPTLVVGGTPLTQNVAILTWIARRFSEARLLPVGDLMTEAKALSLMGWLSSSVHPSFHAQFGALFSIGDAAARAQAIAEARRPSERYFERIDALLQDREWVFGNFSVVDAYLLPFFDWAERLFDFDLARYPHYRAHIERLRARPAVQRVLAREAAAQAAFAA